jgi:predicted acetyltransferase
MTIQIRVPHPEEIDAFRRTESAAFGWEPRADDRWVEILEPERLLCAVDDDAIVGTAGAFSFTLTVPGAEVPAAGVTVVGVLPSHRRRGILTQMMRRQIEDIRALKEPVAILWASEGNIYGRFGYGVATIVAAISADRDRSVFARTSEPQGRVRMIDHDEALKVLPDVYEKVRVATPGMYVRSDVWWNAHSLADPEHEREGGGPMFRAVWEDGGRAGAYALYRIHSEWGYDGVPKGKVVAREIVADSELATREIWRFLFGIDLVTKVQAWGQPVDDPLFLMVAEPRRLRATLHDGLWLRIVTVEDALEARSYGHEGAVVFGLKDPLCPWNEGRWRLDAGPSGATVRAVSESPDLVLDVRELGSAYLGGVSFRRMLRAGRIEEVTEGAATRADSLFATDRAPWCPEIF